MEKGVRDSILQQAQMGQYRLERPALGLCLPSMEPSLPLRGVKLLKPRAHGPAGRAEPRVRPRGGRSRLTCFPPPGWGGAGPGAGPPHNLWTARRPPALPSRGPAGGLRGARKPGASEKTNLERGVTWGPGAESRAEEEGASGRRSAAGPGSGEHRPPIRGESGAAAQAGWAGGCRALASHRDPAAPSPRPR